MNRKNENLVQDHFLRKLIKVWRRLAKISPVISKVDTPELHELSIKNYGGSGGIRDEGLLHCAISRPFQTFGIKIFLQKNSVEVFLKNKNDLQVNAISFS